MFHKKMKDGQYWVWGSEERSRDSLPRFKCTRPAQLIEWYRQQGYTLNVTTGKFMIKLKIGKTYRHVIDGCTKTILNIKKQNLVTTVLFTDGSQMSADALREFYKPVPPKTINA